MTKCGRAKRWMGNKRREGEREGDGERGNEVGGWRRIIGTNGTQNDEWSADCPLLVKCIHRTVSLFLSL